MSFPPYMHTAKSKSAHYWWSNSNILIMSRGADNSIRWGICHASQYVKRRPGQNRFTPKHFSIMSCQNVWLRN